jgi:hypothetical protein
LIYGCKIECIDEEKGQVSTCNGKKYVANKGVVVSCGF